MHRTTIKIPISRAKHNRIAIASLIAFPLAVFFRGEPREVIITGTLLPGCTLLSVNKCNRERRSSQVNFARRHSVYSSEIKWMKTRFFVAIH